jgi:hypothetical protein
MYSHREKLVVLKDKENELTRRIKENPRAINHTLLYEVSRNPNITLKFVLENRYRFFFDWDALGVNKSITIEEILANQHLPWDWPTVCHRDDLTWEIVQAHPGLFQNWLSLSRLVPLEVVLENPQRMWDWSVLSARVPFELIKSKPDGFYQRGWDWAFISARPDITWDIVQSNPDCPWHYGWLSTNPNISLDIVKANPDKGWHVETLSRNPRIGPFTPTSPFEIKLERAITGWKVIQARVRAQTPFEEQLFEYDDERFEELCVRELEDEPIFNAY